MRCESDLTEIDVSVLGLDDLVESVVLLHQIIHFENPVEIIIVGEQNIDESASVLTAHKFMQVILLAVDRDQVFLLQLSLLDVEEVILPWRRRFGDHCPIENVSGHKHVGMVVHFHYVVLWDAVDAESEVVVHEDRPDADGIFFRLFQFEWELIDVRGNVILFHMRQQRQLRIVVLDHFDALAD